MTNLDGLHVALSRLRRDGATNGQHITWSDSQAKWIPETPANAAGETALDAGLVNYSYTLMGEQKVPYNNAPLSANPRVILASTSTQDESISDGFNLHPTSSNVNEFLVTKKGVEADVGTEAGIVMDIKNSQPIKTSTPVIFYCTLVTGQYDLHFRKALDVQGSRWSDRTTVATNIRNGKFSASTFGTSVQVLYADNATGNLIISTSAIATVSFTAVPLTTGVPANLVATAAIEQLILINDLNDYPVIYLHDSSPATDVIYFSYQSASPATDGSGDWAVLGTITTNFEATGNATLGLPVRLINNTIAFPATQASATGDKLFFFRSTGTDGAGPYSEVRAAAALNPAYPNIPIIVINSGNVGIIGSIDDQNVFRNGFSSAIPVVPGDLAALANLVGPAGYIAHRASTSQTRIEGFSTGLVTKLAFFPFVGSGPHLIYRTTPNVAALVTGGLFVGDSGAAPVYLEAGSSLENSHLSVYLDADGLLKSASYPGTIRYVAYE